MDVVVIHMLPEIGSRTIGGPIRFIRVNRARRCWQVFWRCRRPPRGFVSQHRFESDQRGWGEADAVQFFDDLRDFAVTDANHVSQPDRSGSQERTDPTVENLVLASLLDPAATVIATTGLMPIEDNLIQVVDDVFLQVVNRVS